MSIKNSYAISALTAAGCLAILLTVAGCGASRSANQQVAENASENPRIVQPRRHKPTPADVQLVYDYEQLLTPEQQLKLDTLVRTFEKSNLIAIKVNTISAFAAPSGILQYNRQELTDWNQVHGNSEKVMVFTISKSLKYARIDMGADVRQFITEQQAKEILTAQYQPQAAEGAYFQGLYNTLHALTDHIRDHVKFDPQPTRK